MNKRWFGLLALVLPLVLVIVGTAMASSGGTYVLDWYTIDGGGGTTSGGDYALTGTIGQPDAGSMSGGDYAIGGGFWARVAQFLYDLYLPLIMR